jgi:ABC-type nitrate/sulfonate/bicarbonate transport system permease component
MAQPPAPSSPPPQPVGAAPPERVPRRWFRDWFVIRKEIPLWKALLFALLCIAVCFGLWWFVTRGEPEERIFSPYTLPSPKETFDSFSSLWYDRYLTANTVASLKRVLLGFGLAALVGVPLGVLCGCYPSVNAFFLPLSIFGRNIPIAALIPLMFGFFGIGETQKIMFIFIASVAFVVSDTARAVMDVGDHYVDTAYTLGASRWQVILKVLVPLALPSVFNSLRLLFGLAFGYIMLAELVKFGEEAGGLGDLIHTSQVKGPRAHIFLILLIIPVIALVIDRLLYWVQKELFPFRYGGAGLLNQLVRGIMHLWDDLKSRFWKPSPAVELILTQNRKPEPAQP